MTRHVIPNYALRHAAIYEATLTGEPMQNEILVFIDPPVTQAIDNREVRNLSDIDPAEVLAKFNELYIPFAIEGKAAKLDLYAGCSLCPCSPGYRIQLVDGSIYLGDIRAVQISDWRFDKPIEDDKECLASQVIIPHNYFNVTVSYGNEPSIVFDVIAKNEQEAVDQLRSEGIPIESYTAEKFNLND